MRQLGYLLAIVALLAGCAPRQTNQPEQQAPAWRYYVVAAGDTLYSIAGHYETSVEAIQQANNLADATIHPGMRLRIPPQAEQSEGGDYVEVGVASWYGPNFNGKKTASGEVFDMYALTAAHRSLPFGTLVRVTRLDNGASVVVRINDRGPFKKDRIIDLSYAAARQIGLLESGTALVRLEVVSWSE